MVGLSLASVTTLLVIYTGMVNMFGWVQMSSNQPKLCIIRGQEAYAGAAGL